ncbi:MAG: hypothetical protein ACRDT6_06760 [Micromonosporaceae bacterium]
MEPPARLDPNIAPYWAVVAEQWHPDDDARDKILLGMLARTDQSTVEPAVRARLIAEAGGVLAEHHDNGAGECVVCTSAWDGRWPIPYPCWPIMYARMVAPVKAVVASATDKGTDQ